MSPAETHVEVYRLTGYKILHEQEPGDLRVLLLSTEEGETPFLVTRENLLKMSASFAKCAAEMNQN